MKIEYLPGILNSQILLVVSQVGAIQRMLKSEPGIFAHKDILIIMAEYKKYMANYSEICQAFYDGTTVDLIP